MIRGNSVEGHKADIVTIMRVFRAGVTKSNNKFHGRILSHAAVQRQTLAF